MSEQLSGLGQVTAFNDVIGVFQPKIAVIRDADGMELWVDPFSGPVSVPGYHLELRFGVPNPNDPRVTTNAYAFFTGAVGSALSTPGWLGLSWGTWAAIAVAGAIVLPRMLRG